MKTLAFLLALSGFLAGCNADPSHDDRVHALGPERAGVPRGPLHRAGQPCLVCHSGEGPGQAVFSLAGTLYKQKDTTDPLPDAIIHFVDSKSRHYMTGTNCAGNFFVDPHDFDPVRPVWTSIEYGGIAVSMSSPINRAGSCADCHADPPSATSVGHVYFAPTAIPFPPSGCP